MCFLMWLDETALLMLETYDGYLQAMGEAEGRMKDGYLNLARARMQQRGTIAGRIGVDGFDEAHMRPLLTVQSPTTPIGSSVGVGESGVDGVGGGGRGGEMIEFLLERVEAERLERDADVSNVADGGSDDPSPSPSSTPSSPIPSTPTPSTPSTHSSTTPSNTSPYTLVQRMLPHLTQIQTQNTTDGDLVPVRMPPGAQDSIGKLKDPLTWYGFFAPPALRTSQSDFTDALTTLLLCASLKTRLSTLSTLFQALRSQVEHVIPTKV